MSPVAERIELTEEQNIVLRKILRFPKQVQVLGGFGGTGKTVLASELFQQLPGFAVCAYTGKAAAVLRRRGVIANTIHSIIYTVNEYEYWDEEEERYKLGIKFDLKLPSEVSSRGFIVDESSMISSNIHEDLLSFRKPIIYIGDHGQLPPIMSGVLNIMKNPDYRLETIHRNAGEIAHFANFLREGNHPTNWDSEGKVEILGRGGYNRLLEEGIDQIIVAFNATRVKLNRQIRARLGFPPETPVVGDRVMCLKNNKELKIYNGMQGTISEIDVENETLTFSVDGANVPVTYDPRFFNCDKHSEIIQFDKDVVPFDYCYAATCHKCQGDQWDTVAVLEQHCRGWSHSCWCYTAASRAKKRLIWVTT